MWGAKGVSGRIGRGGAVTASHRFAELWTIGSSARSRYATAVGCVALGGEKPRALLAILLLHRNEVVSADRLIDESVGRVAAGRSRRTLRAYVSRLRKALGANGACAAR